MSDTSAASGQPARRWVMWFNHPAAGLVVTGLDLAEYMKFLPSVRDGSITLWRQGFYLPLVAVSLSWSLGAFRQEFDYRWPVRIMLLIGAAVAALNLLPPAWTPALLRTSEFRGQALVMIVCLGVALLSPPAALLPRQLIGSISVLLATWSLWTPLRSFLLLLPDISLIYNTAQHPGWGTYIMVAGLLALLAVGMLLCWPHRGGDA
jgi:hypothetical protein